MSREPYRIGEPSLEYQHQANPVQFPFRQLITKRSRYTRLAVMRNRFAWSEKALSWTDLVKQPVQSITCPAINQEDPAHRFNANTIYDQEDSMVRQYPLSGGAFKVQIYHPYVMINTLLFYRLKKLEWTSRLTLNFLLAEPRKLWGTICAEVSPGITFVKEGMIAKHTSGSSKQYSKAPFPKILSPELMELEQRLYYQDIRFYRSLARSWMCKERITARKAEISTKEAANTSWKGWIWGGTPADSQSGINSGQTEGVLMRRHILCYRSPLRRNSNEYLYQTKDWFFHFQQLQPKSGSNIHKSKPITPNTLSEGIGKVKLCPIGIVVTQPTILELFHWIMNIVTDTGSFPSSPQGTSLSDKPPSTANPATSDTNLDKIRVKVLTSNVVLVLFCGLFGFVKWAHYATTLPSSDTFLKGDSTYPGHNSMVYLQFGSIQFTIVEGIWHRLLIFFSKFAQMKAVMDAASAAALQQANDLSQTSTKMHSWNCLTPRLCLYDGKAIPVLFCPTNLSADPKAVETRPNLQAKANVVKDVKVNGVFLLEIHRPPVFSVTYPTGPHPKTDQHLGLKVLVLVENWVVTLPQLVHFNLSHNARILCRSNNDSSPVLLQQLRMHDKFYWGDVDGDGELDPLLPNWQFPSYLNLIVVNQTDMAWSALPVGDKTFRIAVFILFIVPFTSDSHTSVLMGRLTN
ncbi:hypothetical protein VP01_3238g4 [Puccinia sorghi]|uniref:Vacuolar protein sorting-associated protein 13 VPS13 adaptor binding domain-containing protein n=1 Tax=Puccinia sorghi TaxID=27349 RepID=A0A0L6UY22_9BASI|nr:hypothetical protein VP01_3238g4 [Puccinia sorghi]